MYQGSQAVWSTVPRHRWEEDFPLHIQKRKTSELVDVSGVFFFQDGSGDCLPPCRWERFSFPGNTQHLPQEPHRHGAALVDLVGYPVGSSWRGRSCSKHHLVDFRPFRGGYQTIKQWLRWFRDVARWTKGAFPKGVACLGFMWSSSSHSVMCSVPVFFSSSNPWAYLKGSWKKLDIALFLWLLLSLAVRVWFGSGPTGFWGLPFHGPWIFSILSKGGGALSRAGVFPISSWEGSSFAAAL